LFGRAITPGCFLVTGGQNSVLVIIVEKIKYWKTGRYVGHPYVTGWYYRKWATHQPFGTTRVNDPENFIVLEPHQVDEACRAKQQEVLRALHLEQPSAEAMAADPNEEE
jgi:hypothetical protein